MLYVKEKIKNTFRTPQPEGRASYIRLDQNENPDGVPQWLFDEAMSKITPETLSIYPEEGRLTAKYADMLGVEESCVTLTDGSVVAMGYVFKVFGEEGKNLLCVSPTFGMYGVYAEMEGMNVVKVKYDDHYSLNVNAILDAIDENTGIVSLVNPNMPIGNAYTEEEIISVVKKAETYDALVVIDEAYYYFCDRSSLNLIKEFSNVVILRTFSKMFSVPALRLGAIISNSENIRFINNLKPHYTVNSVALAFGEAIVDNNEKVLEELKEKFFAGKKYLFAELKKDGYSYLPTEGCFTAIVPKVKTAEEITQELKNRNILIFCGKGDSAGLLRVTIWDKKYMKLFMDNLRDIDR